MSQSKCNFHEERRAWNKSRVDSVVCIQPNENKSSSVAIAHLMDASEMRWHQVRHDLAHARCCDSETPLRAVYQDFRVFRGLRERQRLGRFDNFCRDSEGQMFVGLICWRLKGMTGYWGVDGFFNVIWFKGFSDCENQDVSGMLKAVGQL